MPTGDKAYFQFNKGINTEAAVTAWPEGFSIDEENYDLLPDGTRRKRKGLCHLANQTVGSGASLFPSGLPQASGTHYWNSVGGDSTTNFLVMQRNNNLYIYRNDTNTIYTESSGLIDIIDLTPYSVPSASTTQVATSLVDIGFGRGNAVVVGKYINPFLLTYVGGTNPFAIKIIAIVERDFKGQPDGLLLNESSTSANLTVQQSYNLQNRGWTTADMKTYQTALAKWPSKNMIPWLGYRGKTTAAVAEADWTKEFSPDKLVNELFQDVSAPQGHLLMSPLVNSAPPGTSIAPAISTWIMIPNAPNSGGTVQIRITTVAAHGLIVGQNFHWNGQSKFFHGSIPGAPGEPPTPSKLVIYDWTGDYQIQAVTSNTITFQVNLRASFDDFDAWVDQYFSKGSLTFSTVTDITNLNYTDARPEVTAFWGGRAIYTGINDGLFSSKVYFSQILEDDDQYGACYQVADPTDQRISDVVDSDGGVLYIPEMAIALRAEKVGSYLMIFATNGVWSIGPGQSGFFSPTSYSVRKVSDQGLVGKQAVTLCEHVPHYASYHDVFRVVQDPQTGQLNTENMSQANVHTLYTKISDKTVIKAVYNDLRHQLLFLYKDPVYNAASVYNRVMIFDLRLGAVTKFKFAVSNNTTFSAPIDLAVIRESSTVDEDNKLLWSCVQSTHTAPQFWFFAGLIRDTTFGGYTDNGVNGYLSVLTTAYETVQNPVGRKQIPYIWVYSKRTETGFTDTGNDLLPIEPSSTILSYNWNFANNFSSGKVGYVGEVYRHKAQAYVSDDLDYNDGRPVVITKNLVRGQGKVVIFNFVNNDPATASWILGWHVRFRVGGEAP